jgi:hypothetical protein
MRDISAEFGGGIEDEGLFGPGVAGVEEVEKLERGGAAEVGEFGDGGAEAIGRKGGGPGAAGFAGDEADGFEDFGDALGDEADGLTIDEEAMFTDGGFDGEILPGRDGDELGEFEVDGAEAVEEGNEAICVAATECQVGTAKSSPGRGDGAVELFVVNAAEELGLSGGTASGGSGEGAMLAEEAAEVEGRVGFGEDLRFFHRDSRAPELRQICLTRKMRFVDNKRVNRHEDGKVETNLSQLAGPATLRDAQRVAPLIPWYDRGVRD